MKKLLRTLAVFISLALTGLAVEPSMTATPLVNGTNLNGWVKMHDGVFLVTNGVIRMEGGRGWLRTERVFTNFIFEVEWRGLETNYNSGIFVRSPIEGDPWATNIWQVNTKQSAIGELLEGSKKIVPVNAPKIPAGEWIKFRIEARGNELTLDVDGQHAWKFSEFTPASGCIGLQAEGKSFEFRNLSVRSLP